MKCPCCNGHGDKFVVGYSDPIECVVCCGSGEVENDDTKRPDVSQHEIDRQLGLTHRDLGNINLH